MISLEWTPCPSDQIGEHRKSFEPMILPGQRTPDGFDKREVRRTTWCCWRRFLSGGVAPLPEDRTLLVIFPEAERACIS